jgi:hypothetical protein
VPNPSLQIIWHKHLRKSSCSASYSSLILRWGCAELSLLSCRYS